MFISSKSVIEGHNESLTIHRLSFTNNTCKIHHVLAKDSVCCFLLNTNIDYT